MQPEPCLACQGKYYCDEAVFQTHRAEAAEAALNEECQEHRATLEMNAALRARLELADRLAEAADVINADEGSAIWVLSYSFSRELRDALAAYRRLPRQRAGGAEMTPWRGYPCPEPTCRAHDPANNPALCAACEARLRRVTYISHTSPGMDLMALQMLSRMRDRRAGLEEGMTEKPPP